MNTCGTCRFFGPALKDRDLGSEWDEKEFEYKESAYHECKLLQHLNGCSNYGEDAPTAAAGVIDGSGYHATMCVREEFGCNQWEERAAQTVGAVHD